MKPSPPLSWLQYALANMAIVVLVPFLALQGMPPIDWAWSWTRRVDAESQKANQEEEIRPQDRTPVADALAVAITPAANLTGVSTSPWSMFAPAPDATNHRLRATLEYRDGTIVSWRSPEWPELSCWQRFCSSRELEYMDKLSYGSGQERWFAFADSLAARHRQNPAPEGAPWRVTFVLEQAFIDNPNVAGWRPMSETIPRKDKTVIEPKRVYPLPPELQKRKLAPAPRSTP